MKATNKFLKFLNGKGFYAAVGVCLLALGITAIAVTSNIPKAPNVTENESYNSSLEIIIDNPSSEQQVAGEVSGVKAENVSSEETKEEKAPVATFFTLPITGEVIKGYSESELVYSKTYGDMRLHLGLDIKANKGDAVKASGDGVVLGIAKDPLYGTMVTIDHGNGITGLYCGLSDKPSVKQGQTVTAGQNIGAVGDIPCESNDECHLHLAFKDNNKYISPLSLINLGA